MPAEAVPLLVSLLHEKRNIHNGRAEHKIRGNKKFRILADANHNTKLKNVIIL